MPYDNLIDRNDATALIPEEVSNEFMKGMVRQSAVMQLLRRVNMGRKTVRMPILKALPTAYWRNGDTGLAQTSEANWENKELIAEPLDVIVPIPETVLADADYDIWAEIRPLCEEAAGAVIDAAVLFGTNKPSSWPSALVTAAAASGNTFVRGSVGTQRLDKDISDVMALVEDDDFDCNGFAARLGLKGGLRGLRDADGRPIYMPSVNEADGAILYNEQINYVRHEGWLAAQADLITGDWSQAILGMRQDVEFRIYTEGVVTDSNGQIIFNLMQQGMAAMKLTMRVAFQVANFITRGNQSNSTRYPFGVLRPVGYV
jgi:HK97 family phage major capsid protein